MKNSCSQIVLQFLQISDYRNVYISEIYLKSGSKHQQTATVSFSRMVEQGQFSTKEQAIILDTIEEHILQEYSRELDRSKNLVCSITHSRICFYLNSLLINLPIIICNIFLSKSKKNYNFHNICSIIIYLTMETELKKEKKIDIILFLFSMRLIKSINQSYFKFSILNIYFFENFVKYIL